MMRAALDTNIMAYAEGVGDEQRCRKARELVASLPVERVLIPAQTMGELFRVLVGKAGRKPFIAREAVFGWVDSFEVVDSTWSAFQSALDLVVDHRVSIWDGLILSLAAEHRCRLLLSEDFQDGFVWRGVAVVNPLVEPISPHLERLISR